MKSIATHNRKTIYLPNQLRNDPRLQFPPAHCSPSNVYCGKHQLQRLYISHQLWFNYNNPAINTLLRKAITTQKPIIASGDEKGSFMQIVKKAEDQNEIFVAIATIVAWINQPKKQKSCTR